MACSCTLTARYGTGSFAGVCNVRPLYRVGGDRHKDIDLLQDFCQSRLLLGAWPVNARAYSRYNYGVCLGFWRLADSKGTATTQATIVRTCGKTAG